MEEVRRTPTIPEHLFPKGWCVLVKNNGMVMTKRQIHNRNKKGLFSSDDVIVMSFLFSLFLTD